MPRVCLARSGRGPYFGSVAAAGARTLPVDAGAHRAAGCCKRLQLLLDRGELR